MIRNTSAVQTGLQSTRSQGITSTGPQNMDLHGKLEIYIPVEAEVKSIPLWSLPSSVVRGMGLPPSDSQQLSDSPEGIWICPAVIRRKGQKLAVSENMTSLLGRESRAVPGPLQMSFVSANRTAHKVLKDTMPGCQVSVHTSHAPQLPQGSAPPAYKDAVVIYHGRIYLSSRKSGQRRSQREPRDPQPAPQSSTPPSLSSKSPKKRHTHPEPADRRPQKKKLCVTLPQTSPERLGDPLLETEAHSTTEPEPLRDDRPATASASPSDNQKGSDASSSSAPLPVPVATRQLLTADRRGLPAAQEAAGSVPAWCQPEEEEEEEEEEEAAINEGADYIQMDSSQSWTRTPSHGGCTSLQAEFDFKELAEEERIAQMKARLRQVEADLSSLPASQ